MYIYFAILGVLPAFPTVEQMGALNPASSFCAFQILNINPAKLDEFLSMAMSAGPPSGDGNTLSRMLSILSQIQIIKLNNMRGAGQGFQDIMMVLLRGGCFLENGYETDSAESSFRNNLFFRTFFFFFSCKF